MKIGVLVDTAQEVLDANSAFLGMLGINPLLVAGINMGVDMAQGIIDKWGSANRDTDVTQEQIDAEANAAIERSKARTAEYNAVAQRADDDE